GPGVLSPVVGSDGQDWSVSEEVTADWFAPLPLGQRLVPAQWAGLRDKAFVQTVVSESVDIQPGGTGGVLTPVAGRIPVDVRWIEPVRNRRVGGGTGWGHAVYDTQRGGAVRQARAGAG